MRVRALLVRACALFVRASRARVCVVNVSICAWARVYDVTFKLSVSACGTVRVVCVCVRVSVVVCALFVPARVCCLCVRLCALFVRARALFVYTHA